MADLTISEMQKLAMDYFDDPQVVSLVFGGGAGGGKRLSVDTPIPTPTGWILNGDLEDGDLVYAPDGTPTEVVKAHEIVEGDSYRVYFDDGTHIDADGEHLWVTEALSEVGTGIGGNMRTTKEIKDSLKVGGAPNHYIANTKPIEGVEVDGPRFILEDHIPKEYLRASTAQRANIMSQAVSKYGKITKSKMTISLITASLADDVAEIIRSLGLTCIRENKHDEHLVTVLISSKGRYITDVQKIEDRPMRCISVKHPTKMYLAGKQMVPTHNSFLIGLLLAMSAKRYPGTRWGLARKELKSLKQTTLATLISKVHPVLGITENDYKLNLLDSTLEYTNGSVALLLDLTAKPSDPEMESLGSLELTGAFVDEVGEINKKPFDVLSSRVNRWKNAEYGIVGSVVGSCNPSPGFVRQDYYDKYEEAGGGRAQKWEAGHVWVNGERKTAYNAFIRSTALDNPFVDKNYVEGLKRLPPQEKKRLLDGDWNYLDEDDSLFTSRLLDKMTVYEAPEPELTKDELPKFNKFIGIDPSDTGKDETVVTLIDNGVIMEQFEIKSPQGRDEAIGFYIAGKIVMYAEKNGFTKLTAKNITIEGNGIGASTRDALRVMGWNINVYMASLQSRNEGYYQFMLDADAGKVSIHNDIIEAGKLVRQLTAHRYDMDTGKPQITKKKDIRRAIGRSPDHADSAMIANLAANKYKPKSVSSYIRW